MRPGCRCEWRRSGGDCRDESRRHTTFTRRLRCNRSRRKLSGVRYREQAGICRGTINVASICRTGAATAGSLGNWEQLTELLVPRTSLSYRGDLIPAARRTTPHSRDLGLDRRVWCQRWRRCYNRNARLGRLSTWSAYSPLPCWSRKSLCRNLADNGLGQLLPIDELCQRADVFWLPPPMQQARISTRRSWRCLCWLAKTVQDLGHLYSFLELLQAM